MTKKGQVGSIIEVEVTKTSKGTESTQTKVSVQSQTDKGAWKQFQKVCAKMKKFGGEKP